jgi:MFS family permease
MSFRYTAVLNARFGPEVTLIPAMIFTIGGLLLLARTPVDANYAIDILPPMILFGLGAGLAFPSLMTLAMSGATESDSGLASGLVNTSLQVGGAIGLAVLATVSTERTDGLVSDGEPLPSALTSGYHLAYLVGAAVVVAAVGVALSTLRSPARVGAEALEPEPEPVRAVPVGSIEAPALRERIRPLPDSALAAIKAGCAETGTGLTIGCGACPPGATKATDVVGAAVTGATPD